VTPPIICAAGDAWAKALLPAVQGGHVTLHDGGVARLSTAIKLGTRTDKGPRLADRDLR
jgi:hypothetical protein